MELAASAEACAVEHSCPWCIAFLCMVGACAVDSDSRSSVLILNFHWQNLNGGNGTACTFTFSPRRFSRQLQTPTKYIFLESSLIGESIGWSFVHFTATLRCSVGKTVQNWLKASDTCPLCHVLNLCQVALNLRRYNDSVLTVLYTTISQHLPESVSSTVDLAVTFSLHTLCHPTSDRTSPGGVTKISQSAWWN